MRHGFLLIKLSFRNTFRNKRRSLFAIGTMMIGAMGLFLFMGFNHGLMKQYRDNTIHAKWGHGQIYVKGYREEAPIHSMEKWIQEAGWIMGKLREFPGVVDLFPRVTLHAVLIAGDKSVTGQGEGIDGVAEAKFFTELNYVEGQDFQGSLTSIVLGQGLAKGLGVKVGDKIQIAVRNPEVGLRSHTVNISGIFHTGSHEFDSRAFRIPLSLAQNLLQTDLVETIAVALINEEAWTPFTHAVGRAFPELETFSFDELDEVYYSQAVNWLDAQFGFIRGIFILMELMVVLGVVSNTVLERTSEIATLRANGESCSDILLNFMLEGVMLGLMAGMLGIVGAWMVSVGPFANGISMPPAPGFTRSYRIFIELDALGALQTFLLCIGTAVGGTLFSVWHGINIPIARALRAA